jgi:hypothetical protein
MKASILCLLIFTSSLGAQQKHVWLLPETDSPSLLLAAWQRW